MRVTLYPLRDIMEMRKGGRAQVHFLLGVPAHLSRYFCVIKVYIYLLN